MSLCDIKRDFATTARVASRGRLPRPRMSAKKVAVKAKPESYQSALAQFCSSALRADAKKKATKAPLASAVKKRASASAVLNGAKKRPKAPLVGDGTKFTPAQHFAGPTSSGLYEDRDEDVRAST